MTGKDGRGRAWSIASTRTPPAAAGGEDPFLAATALAKTFRTRSARKDLLALVAGVPRPKQGRVSTFLAKEDRGTKA